MVLLSLVYAWVLSTCVDAVEIPAEIADLCRILRDQIVNKCECLPEVTTDFAGRARPAGGGCDCGAIECDAGDMPISPFPPIPPPAGARLVLNVFPRAPLPRVRWSVGLSRPARRMSPACACIYGFPTSHMSLASLRSRVACIRLISCSSPASVAGERVVCGGAHG